MKIKATHNTTKYYAGNKKISKTHGVIFMIIGFIILAPLLKTFGGFVFYMFYEPPIHVDCNQPDVKSSFIEYQTQFNYSMESYEKIKNKFYTETFEEQESILKKWKAAIFNTLETWGQMHKLYANNRQYFDYCYNYSVSDYLDTKEQYITSESKIITNEARSFGEY